MKHCMRFKCLFAVLLMAGLPACTKETDTGPGTYTIAFTNMSLKPANLLPGDTSTQTQAVGIFNVRSDHSLDYDVYFTSLAAGEQPQSITIYSGDAASNGAELLSISGVQFSNREATGRIDLPAALVDSFAAGAPMYVVVGAVSHTGGLVRGQVTGLAVNYATDISLTADSIRPAVSTPATAKAYLRILADGTTVYSRITVSGLPENDTLVSAAIRNRLDKSVVMTLAATVADFNTSKKITVASAAATAIQSGALYYMDIRTRKYPAGLLQGYYK